MPSQEFDDQRVPVAKLSNSSSTDTSASPQVNKFIFHFQMRSCFIKSNTNFLFYKQKIYLFIIMGAETDYYD